MLKTLLIQIILSFSIFSAWSQAKKPSLMVVPSDDWCRRFGYVSQLEDDTTIPDYQKALESSMDLQLVLTKISAIMQKRGFPPKNLQSFIKQQSYREVENALIRSTSTGAGIKRSPIDILYEQSQADIILQVSWKVETTGPRKSVSFALLGIDNYTLLEVGAASGTGPPSYATELPVLLEEAVLMHLDNFCGLLQQHFDQMFAQGRKVVIEAKIFDDDSDITFETEFGEKNLEEIIDDYLYQNAEQQRFSKNLSTETHLQYNPVNIPLFDRTTQRPLDTRIFVRGIQRMLSTTYNITSKIYSNGLGRALLVIGEK